MYLADLELFLVEIPAGDGGLRTLLVRVVDESGQEGWGETQACWQPGELPARRKALLSVLAGRSIHDVESILAEDSLADPAAACGVEMALWAMIAKLAKQPLCHLFGGAYRASVPVAIRLWSGTPELVVHWARTFAAQSIGLQTISSTGTRAGDLQLVAALHEACAHRVQFRLDGREQFDPREAARLCAELAPESVSAALDLVPAAQLDYLRVGQVPLGCYAVIRSPADVAALARGGNVSQVLIDPTRVGGLLRARQCAVVADALGMTAGLRLLGTSGLALAASLHVAAATPQLESGHECSYPQLHDDVLTEPLRMGNGMLQVPMGIGLGVEVDRDKVDWYQVG